MPVPWQPASLRARDNERLLLAVGNAHSLRTPDRQRVAIARALFRNPEILILDEATSALDSASERVVQKALDDVTKTGITMVVVAHRLSTIQGVDAIYVLDRGHIVESGSHNELISHSELYAILWAIQTGEAEAALPQDV